MLVDDAVDLVPDVDERAREDALVHHALADLAVRLVLALRAVRADGRRVRKVEVPAATDLKGGTTSYRGPNIASCHRRVTVACAKSRSQPRRTVARPAALATRRYFWSRSPCPIVQRPVSGRKTDIWPPVGPLATIAITSRARFVIGFAVCDLVDARYRARCRARENVVARARGDRALSAGEGAHASVRAVAPRGVTPNHTS